MSSISPPSSIRACAPTGVLHEAPSARVSSRSAVTHAVASVVDQPARSLAGPGAPRARAPPGRRPGRARRACRPRRRPSRCKAGHRQHQRVALAVGELAQPRVDVAAHLHDLEVLADRAELRRAAQAAGADARAGTPAPTTTARRRSRRADPRAPVSRRARVRPPARRARPWPSARRRRSRRRAAPARAPRPIATCPRPRRPGRRRSSRARARTARPVARATHSACASASALPRVPSRINGVAGEAFGASVELGYRLLHRRGALDLQTEQVADQRHPGVHAVVAELLQPRRRLVQQPVDDRAGDRVDALEVALGQPPPTCRRSRPPPARRSRCRERAAPPASAAPRATRATRRTAGSPPR